MNKVLVHIIALLYSANLLISYKISENYIPLIDLGEVDLKNIPGCDRLLKPKRIQCEANYRDLVNKTKQNYGMDITTESVKRAVCCGAWKAKDCVMKAAIDLNECGLKVAKMYENLPIDGIRRKEVLDDCSEYGENATICEDIKNSGFNISISLVLIIMMNIIFLYNYFKF